MLSGWIFYVAHDADDLHPVLFLRFAPEGNSFSESALARPIALRHGLVDNEDLALWILVSVEKSSA